MFIDMLNSRNKKDLLLVLLQYLVKFQNIDKLEIRQRCQHTVDTEKSVRYSINQLFFENRGTFSPIWKTIFFESFLFVLRL